MSEEDTNFEPEEGPEEAAPESSSNRSPEGNQEPPQREPIPAVLHSFYEERPFVSCTRCGESLEHFDEGYRISKNFKGNEVIIEYALCMPCLNAMLDEASEESKQRLAEFQNERYRDVSGFNDCALCEKQLDEVKDEEYGLVGVCHGDDMVDSAMICFGCMEDMAEIMSEETRRTWDKFREENFPGVPSDFEPLPSRPAPVTL